MSGTLTMDASHYISVQIQRHALPRGNPNVNSGPSDDNGQYRLINCSKCTTVVVDADTGGKYRCEKVQGRWEIGVTSTQFCCDLKTALNIKSI